MRTTKNQRAAALPTSAATTEGGQDYGPTKPNKWLFTAAVLGVVLLAAATDSSRAVRRWQTSGAPGWAFPERGLCREVTLARVAGSGQGFGPVVEATLPAAGANEETQLLDLETGRSLVQLGIDHFNGDSAAFVSWTRTNGMHICGRVWSDGSADCVTYNMTVVPVEPSCWSKAGDLPAIPLLGPGQHSPRRLLVLGGDHTGTYAFRTDEGTLGMLCLAGLSDDHRGVKIRYKLLQARGSEQTAARIPKHA